MIKRKNDIDNNVAFKESCKNNDIILTDRGENLNPVAYIDLKGKERFFNSLGISNAFPNINFHIGDTVRIFCKTKNGGHERVRVIKGVVLRRKGTGARETVTVRKSSGIKGVEKTWLIHSTNIERIEVVRRGKVRTKSNHQKSV